MGGGAWAQHFAAHGDTISSPSNCRPIYWKRVFFHVTYIYMYVSLNIPIRKLNHGPLCAAAYTWLRRLPVARGEGEEEEEEGQEEKERKNKKPRGRQGFESYEFGSFQYIVMEKIIWAALNRLGYSCSLLLLSFISPQFQSVKPSPLKSIPTRVARAQWSFVYVYV